MSWAGGGVGLRHLQVESKGPAPPVQHHGSTASEALLESSLLRKLKHVECWWVPPERLITVMVACVLPISPPWIQLFCAQTAVTNTITPPSHHHSFSLPLHHLHTACFTITPCVVACIPPSRHVLLVLSLPLAVMLMLHRKELTADFRSAAAMGRFEPQPTAIFVLQVLGGG